MLSYLSFVIKTGIKPNERIKLKVTITQLNVSTKRKRGKKSTVTLNNSNVSCPVLSVLPGRQGMR